MLVYGNCRKYHFIYFVVPVLYNSNDSTLMCRDCSHADILTALMDIQKLGHPFVRNTYTVSFFPRLAGMGDLQLVSLFFAVNTGSL